MQEKITTPVDIENFLPDDLKKKYVIFSPASKAKIKSTNPVFRMGAFPAIDVSQLNEATIQQLIRQKHPAFATKEKFDKIVALDAKAPAVATAVVATK